MAVRVEENYNTIVGDSRVVSAGLLFNATVADVRPDSPAAIAGLATGDILCTVAGINVRPIADLGAVEAVLTSIGVGIGPLLCCTVLRERSPHAFTSAVI